VLFYIQLFSYFRCNYVIKRSVQFSSVIDALHMPYALVSIRMILRDLD